MVVLVMVVLQIGFAGYGAFYAAHKLEDEGSSITDKTFQDGFGLHAGFGSPSSSVLRAQSAMRG